MSDRMEKTREALQDAAAGYPQTEDLVAAVAEVEEWETRLADLLAQRNLLVEVNDELLRRVQAAESAYGRNVTLIVRAEAAEAENGVLHNELHHKKTALRNCREAHLAAEAERDRLREALEAFLAPWEPDHYPQLRAALGEQT